jgi:hypothetical protein
MKCKHIEREENGTFFICLIKPIREDPQGTVYAIARCNRCDHFEANDEEVTHE